MYIVVLNTIYINIHTINFITIYANKTVYIKSGNGWLINKPVIRLFECFNNFKRPFQKK